jgi:hypothetical protein
MRRRLSREGAKWQRREWTYGDSWARFSLVVPIEQKENGLDAAWLAKQEAIYPEKFTGLKGDLASKIL